jgi:hypothetical protein
MMVNPTVNAPGNSASIGMSLIKARIVGHKHNIAAAPMPSTNHLFRMSPS